MVKTTETDDFLGRQGWGRAERAPLAGDASTRHYIRLTRGPDTAILMQAPLDAMTAEFVMIDEILTGLGLSAPRILSAVPEQGLILLEDFGDDTYTALLDRGTAAGPLYELATRTLIHLHQGFNLEFTGAQGLPDFGSDRFLEQSMLFAEICLPDLADGKSNRLAESFRQAWKAPLANAMAVPRSLLLRDFHAGNLFHLPDRDGVRACGLIDFQDAGIGPVTYDLVSLLQDARRDVAEGVTAACLKSYLAAFPELDTVAFNASYAVMAAQRHTRVIAIFHRLASQGKNGYLEHLPRLWRRLDEALKHPALVDVAAWFHRHMPPAVQIAQQGQQK